MAAQLGYCGLDRRRQPLVGDEIRACWEGWPISLDPRPGDAPTIAPAALPATAARRIDFVEVDVGAVDVGAGIHATSPGSVGSSTAAGQAGEPRWSLWGDPDR